MYELHMGNEEHYLFSCYCNQPLERMTILEQKRCCLIFYLLKPLITLDE